MSQAKVPPPPPAAVPPMHQPVPQQAAHLLPLAMPYSQGSMAQPPPYAHLAPSIPQTHTPVHHPTPPVPPPAAMYPPPSAHMSHTQGQAPPYYRPPPMPGMPQVSTPAPPPLAQQPPPGAQAPPPALDPAQRVRLPIVCCSLAHIDMLSSMTGDVDAGFESDARADQLAAAYGARADSAAGTSESANTHRPC